MSEAMDDASKLPRRGPGRPRKWATEAERKRAYRERLAADIAEPARLRRDLRAARKRIGELEQALTDLRRDYTRASRSLERCAEQRDRQAGQVSRFTDEVRDLRNRLTGGML
jgi:chromosome segregation ATPase